MTLGRRNSDGAYHFDGAAERVADNTIPGTGFRVFSQVYGEDGPDRHHLAIDSQTVLDTRTTVGRAYSAIATNVVLGRAPGLGAFGGDLVEWLVYDRVLSVEERFEVEEYLRQRARLSEVVSAGSCDLSSWDATSYGTGVSSNAVWNLDLAGRTATLTNATDPTLLLSPFTVSNQVVRARIGSTASTGFFGFAFGYKDSGNFVLFDWSRTASNHPALGLAPAGMRLRSFHTPAGDVPTAADFWSSPDPAHVTALATNGLPWVPGKIYDLTLRLLGDHTGFHIADGTNTLANWLLPQLTHTSGPIGFYAFQAPGIQLGEVSFPGATPVLLNVSAQEGTVEVTWMNGEPPFVIEGSSSLKDGEWFEIAPATLNYSQRITVSEAPLFFRVRGAGPTPTPAPVP